MLKRLIALILVFILSSTPLLAQGTSIDRLTPPFPTAGERRAADIISWGTVLTSLALDTKASWDSPDRAHALQLQGVRIFVIYVSTSLAKNLANRTRPDLSDNKSFYSGHTALAFSTLGGPRISIGIPLDISTGALRVAGGKHWLTDVLVGAAVGSITSRIRAKK